jgi:hypothetical protein
MMAERLRKEQDESCQTEERLRTERGTARAEHDAVFWTCSPYIEVEFVCLKE